MLFPKDLFYSLDPGRLTTSARGNGNSTISEPRLDQGNKSLAPVLSISMSVIIVAAVVLLLYLFRSKWQGKR